MPQRFNYVPRSRRWFHTLLDLVVLVVVLGFVHERAWHWEVTCAWKGTRASCTYVREDAIGRHLERHIEGIRGLAFKKGNSVGFVTDATHADELSLFATSEVEVGSRDEAEALRRFADERTPESIELDAGLPHPVFVTVLGLVAILAWGFFTRTRRLHLTVDAKEKKLVVDAGILRGTQSFDLATTTIDLERDSRGAHRVCLTTKDGPRRLSEGYFAGEHHAALVRAVSVAMKGG